MGPLTVMPRWLWRQWRELECCRGALECWRRGAGCWRRALVPDRAGHPSITERVTPYGASLAPFALESHRYASQTRSVRLNPHPYDTGSAGAHLNNKPTTTRRLQTAWQPSAARTRARQPGVAGMRARQPGVAGTRARQCSGACGAAVAGAAAGRAGTRVGRAGNKGWGRATAPSSPACRTSPRTTVQITWTNLALGTGLRDTCSR